ncbi:MAG TPA: SCO family protein [Rhodocyclaceae bacterium]|nr:SCO family protein [Rhodocyclaceae bacterium]
MKLPLNSAQRAILLIIVLLAMPFVLGWALYAYGWRPQTTGNYGELLQPPPQLPASALLRNDGQPLQRDALLGKWQFVLVGDTPCDDACRHALHQMRQVQVSLNKDMGRIKRLWINPGAATDPATPGILAEWPDLQVARAPDAAWNTAFPTANRVYLVDPLGNVILRYPSDPDWKRVRKDIEKLMKTSWTG